MKSKHTIAEPAAVYGVAPFGITRDTIRDVVDTIAERVKPDKIVIFGSCAQRDLRQAEDLDLLIIQETRLPPHKRAVPIRLLFDPTPCPMDILVFTPKEVEHWNGTVNHIVTEALRTGVVAYEKSGA